MNRKIFVTGATSGIGLECARAFAQDGDNVLIAGRRADRLAAIKEDAVTMINTNVLGLLYVTKAVLPFMIDKNEGHIVNMGSTAGIYAYPGGAVYCATKAAVKMLADGIRMDTIATDIKVTTIQPGIVETPFSEVRFHGDAERAKSVYAGIEAVQPEDVADVVLYVTNQPKRMQISDVTIMANQQAAGFMVHKK